MQQGVRGGLQLQHGFQLLAVQLLVRRLSRATTRWRACTTRWRMAALLSQWALAAALALAARARERAINAVQQRAAQLALVTANLLRLQRQGRWVLP